MDQLQQLLPPFGRHLSCIAAVRQPTDVDNDESCYGYSSFSYDDSYITATATVAATATRLLLLRLRP